MRSGLVVAVAALVVTAVPAAPTWAESERRAPLVSAVDASGDVKIRDVKGPSSAERRNVDLLGFRVVPQEDGLVRFTFEISEVTAPGRLDQLLTVSLVDQEPGPERTEGRISLRVQHTRSGYSEGSVETATEGSGGTCSLLTVVVVRARGLVKLDVPPQCLPPGQLGLRVKSFTTTQRGERRTVYARDFLRVPGSYDLGGRVGAGDPY